MSTTEIKEHVIFISDRGPNIKYGLIREGFTRLTCYSHIIHNLVSFILTEQKVKQIVQQCAVLSSYIKNTGLNKQLKPSLKRYTATRWNSVFIMIDCIIKSYNDVYKLLITKQRLRNECKINSNKQPDHEISDMVSVLNQSELIEIRDFLGSFKVGFLINISPKKISVTSIINSIFVKYNIDCKYFLKCIF